ncbi:arginyl-tRNA synthetase [Ignisphaera aggregans DSM 17230]|uniref:Arginine--tRNA ligase n=1 Tax=Ignisphaera aggregans (strain DSM 17230 / JCM 13409 / AQ1.S1) TaxID=583356 RepID=E0SQ42_IGNAA|nr:arginyl-tRNA synthetase [Ignisphaera aggregans DSM 17230]
MPSLYNPMEIVRRCIASEVSKDVGVDIEAVEKAITIPREEFGDLSIVLSKIGIDIALEKILNMVNRCSYVKKSDGVGIYVNMFLDRTRFTELVFNSIVSGEENYGIFIDDKPRRVVIEYVSANPIHPLHIGAARNAVLGDFLARIHRKTGNTVQTRFYINDVGRQVALLALGIMKLGSIDIPNDVKPDHWLGTVYAITNTIAEIYTLKKRLENTGDIERKELVKELDQLLIDASKLREIAPEIFDKISEELKNIDIEQEISKIMRSYERGEEWIKNIIRKTVELCIKGFKETLSRLGIEIEIWDWESDLVWSKEVDKLIDELKKRPETIVHKGAYALDFTEILKDTEIRRRLRIPENLEIPPLIFQRSDGTTLYTVRDIVYTLKKFREFNADQVINVIASEQTLPQAQIRLALYLLGYRKEAENLLHYSYEIVNVEGMKMSSRRGRIITLDSIIEEAKIRALAELEKRGNRSEELAEKIGIAAIKFYLLSVTPSRPVKFAWESVLNFERNSAPYLLYTYARVEGIFRKAREKGIELNWKELLSQADLGFAENHSRRWRLIKYIAEYPDIFKKTYLELDPSILATYILRLADEFNSWYDEEPIVLEQDPRVRASKLLLVYSIRTVLRNALEILGIEVVERL